MEKCTNDNESNGTNPLGDNAIQRQLSCPSRGKMPEGQKGVVVRQPSCPLRGKMSEGQKGVEKRVVVQEGFSFYKFAYPDRVAILKENARKNRLCQTDAEIVLWEYLRRNALGVRFRRQFIIGDFIADFACIEKRLVIEVDGQYHLTDEQIEEDRKRTYHISQLGFRVIRFTNEEIMTNINKVITTIKTNLNEQ